MQQFNTQPDTKSIMDHWDELDCLVDQLRAMVGLLQNAPPCWNTSPLLVPYMQVMEDMLVQVDNLHQGIRAATRCPDTACRCSAESGQGKGEAGTDSPDVS